MCSVEVRFDSAVASEVVELHQFVDDDISLAAGNALGDACLQVVFQDEGLQFLDGLAHCVRLTQDIDAILVFVDHFANTFEVPLDVIQAFNDFLFSARIYVLLFTPIPGVWVHCISLRLLLQEISYPTDIMIYCHKKVGSDESKVTSYKCDSATSSFET